MARTLGNRNFSASAFISALIDNSREQVVACQLANKIRRTLAYAHFTATSIQVGSQVVETLQHFCMCDQRRQNEMEVCYLPPSRKGTEGRAAPCCSYTARPMFYASNIGCGRITLGHSVICRVAGSWNLSTAGQAKAKLRCRLVAS